MARKRWDRSKYPENWEEMSRAFRESRNYRCEYCGTAQGTWRTSKAGNTYRSITAAAHRYPNDTRNLNPDLLCLCERCHGRHDGYFRGIIAEGVHQALMHEILLERRWEQNEEVMSMGQPYWWDEDEDGVYSDEPPVLDVPFVRAGVELVCCSCGVRDAFIAFGCCRCGRPVHYRKPGCGGWLLNSRHDAAATENEFWCLRCLADG